MAKWISRDGLKKILIITGIGVIALQFTPGCIQRRNMNRAEAYMFELRPSIAADPRFANVNLKVHTIDMGCLFVIGSVSSKNDLDALRDVVMAKKPDFTVRYMVQIK